MDIWQVNDAQVAAFIRSTRDRVELWSSHRLPFEPKGVLLEARNRIRILLRNLAATSECMLEARYLSTFKRFVDTENVLIYNVGTSAFASASRYGLRFIREFTEPPLAPNNHSIWRHYHCYALVPRAKSNHPSIPTAQFRFRLDKLSTSLKPHDYWWAAKAGLADVDHRFDSAYGPFKMTAEITGPSFRANPAALVKPLFDGVISAVHYDPGVNRTDPAIDRIAAKLMVSPVQVAESLRDSSHVIFGKRKLVHPTITFVAWNPADEECLIGELLVRYIESTTWSIDVTVSPVNEQLLCVDNVL